MIRCKKCGDVIESTHRHDFKFCKCGAVAADGGKDYRYLVVMLDDFLASERFELTFFLTNDIIILRYNDIICAVKGGAVY